METSAKTKHGISTLFNVIAEEIFRDPRSEPLPRNSKQLKEDMRTVESELWGGSRDSLAPTAKKYASRYSRLMEDPNSTVWRLNDDQRSSSSLRVLSPSRSRFFRRVT